MLLKKYLNRFLKIFIELEIMFVNFSKHDDKSLL